MNHRKFGKKLSRNHHERQALFRSLIRSLFEKGSLQTTEAKAKAIIPQINKLGNLILHRDVITSSRRLQKYINNRKLVTSIVSEFKIKMADVNGNLAKLTRIKYRQGDNALIVKIEFVKPYSLPVPQKPEKEKSSSKVKPVSKENKAIGKIVKTVKVKTKK